MNVASIRGPAVWTGRFRDDLQLGTEKFYEHNRCEVEEEPASFRYFLIFN